MFFFFYILPSISLVIILFILVYFFSQISKVSTELVFFIVQTKDQAAEKRSKILVRIFFILLYTILVVTWIHFVSASRLNYTY